MEISAAIVLVIVFAFLLIMGTPVSFSIITSAAVTITMFLSPKFAMFIAAQKLTTGIDSFSLLAVPFFILAGNLMGSGGLAQRLVNLAMLVLGRVPGSLALTNIAGNAMFGSLSGSGIAAASAMGSVLRDPEKNAGYEEEFSAATNIATAPVGQLIPPTNAFIIYSAACGGVSVATLFIAGWVPGLLWAALCMVAAFLFAKKHGYVVRNAQKLSFRQVFKTIWDAVPSILMIVIIIGGILSGVFSPTEASGVAVVYAFILSVCIYRSIKLREIKEILVNTASMTTIVMLIIGASAVLSFVLSFTGLPQAISTALLSITTNKYILLIINVILLVVGTFMDMAPALLIFTPIFLPVVTSIGMDPIHFGVMMVMNLAVGTITPPVGSVLFVGCSVANLKVEKVVPRLIPYFIAIVIGLVLVTFIPALSLGLPSLFGMI